MTYSVSVMQPGFSKRAQKVTKELKNLFYHNIWTILEYKIKIVTHNSAAVIKIPNL